MERITFPDNEAYFPITHPQFESLVNELLAAVNKLSEPNFVHSDFFVQVVNSVLHSTDRKEGTIKKDELFERCVHLIGCQVSAGVVEGIIAKLQAEEAKAKAEAGEPTLAAVPDMPTEH